MAKTVYDEETIQLQNGQEVTLRPLNIKNLRLFNVKMKELREINEPTEDEQMDLVVAMAGICLRAQAPELVDNGDELEEALDLTTIYKILDVCAGVKFTDPNLQAAAIAAMNQMG